MWQRRVENLTHDLESIRSSIDKHVTHVFKNQTDVDHRDRLFSSGIGLTVNKLLTVY